MITTKELNKKVKEYILDAIDETGYDTDGKEITTPAQKIAFIYTTFKSEKDWHIKQIGEYKAFTDWIQGLPTCFNIDFENYKIIELAKKWGSIPENATEKQEDKILNNWFNLITVKFFQLVKKYKKEV